MSHKGKRVLSLEKALSGEEPYFTNLLKRIFDDKVPSDELSDIIETSTKTVDFNSYSMVILGMIAYKEKNYQRAIELFDRAIDLGNSSGMSNRGFMHKHGLGGPIDLPRAIELYDHAIDLGDPFAMHNRAFMHRHGNGGPVDYPKAIELYDKAIDLGNYSAMNNRAYMCKDGEGGPIDIPRAIELYDKAIDLGDSNSMNNRACMYKKGEGGPVNYLKAIKLFDRAIFNGNQISFNHLKLHIRDFPKEFRHLIRFALFGYYFFGVKILEIPSDIEMASSYFDVNDHYPLLFDLIKTNFKDSDDIEKAKQLVNFGKEKLLHLGNSKIGIRFIYYNMKLLLLEQNLHAAYELYETFLPSDLILTGTEYFMLASFLLNFETETTKQKALKLLYQAHIQGDRESTNILIRLLRGPKEGMIELSEINEVSNLEMISKYAEIEEQEEKTSNIQHCTQFMEFKQQLQSNNADLPSTFRTSWFSSDISTTLNQVETIIEHLQTGETLVNIIKKSDSIFTTSSMTPRVAEFIDAVLPKPIELLLFQ